MHPNNIVDAAILHGDSNGFVILHYYNGLVSSPCVVEILPNFKEHLFQENPFNGFYRIQDVGLGKMAAIVETWFYEKNCKMVIRIVKSKQKTMKDIV